MNIDFKSGVELLEQCIVQGMTISEVTKQRECNLTGVSVEDMETGMKDVLAVMGDSATLPLREPVTPIGGLIGRKPARMEEWRRRGTSILSDVLNKTVIYAMAVLEVNTSMGLIVAAPTVGSSGIVPGLLLALQEEYGLEDDSMADGLFATSAIEYLAIRNATVSGMVEGCQAEANVACAMAVAVTIEPMGGTPIRSLDAASAALMDLLGLVCDPVNGLIGRPCQNRNGAKTANTLVCAEIVFSGIRQLTPLDEMLEAMYAAGRGLPLELRKTALGGRTATPSSCRMGCCVQET